MADLPNKVPVVPVRAGFYFPGVKVPLSAGRTRSTAALAEAVKTHGYALLVHQKEVEAPEPPPELFPTIGTLARVAGGIDANARWVGTVHGITRAWAGGWHPSTRMLRADVVPVASAGESPQALARLRAAMIRVIELDPDLPKSAAARVAKIEDLSLLTDIAAQNGDIGRPEKQRLLETASAVARVAALIPAYEAHAARLTGVPPPRPDPPPPAPQDDLGEIPTDPLGRVRWTATLLARCGDLPPVGVIAMAMEEVEGTDPDTRQIAERLARQATNDRRAVEDRWPLSTDFDRLDAAFVALDHAGVAARHDWGLDPADAAKLVHQELRRKAATGYTAALYYHHRQTRGAALGRGLKLTLHVVSGDAIATGRRVVEALRAQGLPAFWPEDPDEPIDVPIRWQRRMPPDPG